MRRKQNWKRMMAWLLTAAMMAGNSSFPVLAQEMPEIMLIDEENLSDSIPTSGSEAAHSHDSIEIEGISTVADPGLTEAGLESESETESETETETETETEAGPALQAPFPARKSRRKTEK